MTYDESSGSEEELDTTYLRRQVLLRPAGRARQTMSPTRSSTFSDSDSDSDFSFE